MARARPQRMCRRPPGTRCPLSELAIALGALGMIVSAAISNANGLAASFLLVLAGTVEFSWREHRHGHRSHGALLAGTLHSRSACSCGAWPTPHQRRPSSSGSCVLRALECIHQLLPAEKRTRRPLVAAAAQAGARGAWHGGEAGALCGGQIVRRPQAAAEPGEGIGDGAALALGERADELRLDHGHARQQAAGALAAPAALAAEELAISMRAISSGQVMRTSATVRCRRQSRASSGRVPDGSHRPCQGVCRCCGPAAVVAADISPFPVHPRGERDSCSLKLCGACLMASAARPRVPPLWAGPDPRRRCPIACRELSAMCGPASHNTPARSGFFLFQTCEKWPKRPGHVPQMAHWSDQTAAVRVNLY